MKRAFIVVALLSVSTARLYAQGNEQRLDSLFTTLATKHEFNGNVLIAQNATVVYRHSFGYADAVQQTLNTEHTAFHLASISKIFTAVAILQLKQRGKLDLDDRFARHFPDFPYPEITLRQMLSHTSGLPDYQIFEQPYRDNPSKVYVLADLIPALRADKRGLLSKPGDRFNYSNTGFGLLALLVEKVSGMTFQDYLRTFIFQPAGMTHTYVQSPLIPVDDAHRATGYDFVSYAPDQLTNADSLKRNYIDNVVLAGILGPRGIVSTTSDLLEFDQALYGGKLLKPAILEEAFVPTVLNGGGKAMTGFANTKSYYGLGWMILCDSTYGKVVWHSGGAAGMVTVFLRNITRKQTVIVLDNVTHRGLHSQGVNALYALNGGPLFHDKESLASAYVIALHQKGPDHAAVVFDVLKADTAHYFMSERDLNRFGYDLVNDGYKDEALEAFKLNTIVYPESFNVYDSYAETLASAGKREDAIMLYKRLLTMKPDDKNTLDALRRLTGEH